MESQNTNLPAPQEKILEETRLKIAIARQHLDALATFGLTATWVNQLEATADRAETMPSHTDQLNEQKLLTAEKDSALADYSKWGRALRLRMELVFSRNSVEYRQFPAQRFRDSERNESKAILLLPTLLRLAQQQAAKLADAGQTATDITTGQAIQTRLKATNEAQEEYKLTRTTVSRERQQAYRDLVAGVQRINQIGQAIYDTDSPNRKLFRNNWTASETTPNEPSSPETTPSQA